MVKGATVTLMLVAALAVGFYSGHAAAERQAPAVAQLQATAAPAPSGPAPAPLPSSVPAPDAPPEASGPDAGSSGPRRLPEGLSPEETRNIEIFRRASASVVFITNIALRRDFFTLNVFEIPQSSGSGFVWDSEGHIVTNFHVIEGGSSFSVTLADQSSWEATVTGVAPDKDLAVIRIEAPAGKLSPLPLGSSHDLLVGQTVLAVGNPFGLDHSLTVGVVSALGRELQSPNGRTIHDVIQTDAAINPGNSGGPLLDSGGRVVGVNSAIYSPSGAFSGVGFAVPVDTVKRLVPQMIEHGRPIQPGIGVRLLADSVAERFQIKGVAIYDVVAGSTAERAGLEGLRTDRYGRAVLGDQIIAVDGKPVETGDDLMHAFETSGVGATVTLTVERGGRRRDVAVKLAALEQSGS